MAIATTGLLVSGSAEPGTTVVLSWGSGCARPLGRLTAAQLAQEWLLPFTQDAGTEPLELRLSAQAESPSGVSSACSESPPSPLRPRGKTRAADRLAGAG